MNTTALIFMVVTLSLITGFTAFFFVKMLTTKKESETEIEPATETENL